MGLIKKEANNIETSPCQLTARGREKKTPPSSAPRKKGGTKGREEKALSTTKKK